MSWTTCCMWYNYRCRARNRQRNDNQTIPGIHWRDGCLGSEKYISNCAVAVTFIIGSCPEHIQIQQTCGYFSRGIKHGKTRKNNLNFRWFHCLITWIQHTNLVTLQSHTKLPSQKKKWRNYNNLISVFINSRLLDECVFSVGLLSNSSSPKSINWISIKYFTNFLLISQLPTGYTLLWLKILLINMDYFWLIDHLTFLLPPPLFP